MAMMLSKTYEAFVDAGASIEKAQAASVEIASFERRLMRLEIMSAIVLAGVVSLVLKAFV